MSRHLEIIVKVDIHDDRNDVMIAFLSNQEKLSIKDTTHLLVSGVALLVKSCSKHESNIKDYELMSEVLEHLNHEFIDIKSFEDSVIIKNTFKDDNSTSSTSK